jgi:hypothetical protein
LLLRVDILPLQYCVDSKSSTLQGLSVVLVDSGRLDSLRIRMSAEAMPKVAKGEHGDVASVSQVQGNEKSNHETSGGGVRQKDDEVVENQQLGANEPHTEPEVHVSAHEQDRKEQASRRIKEAQQYHERDKRARGSGRAGRVGHRNNNRFDPTKQEKSDDPVAIRKQVKFLYKDSVPELIVPLGRVLLL